MQKQSMLTVILMLNLQACGGQAPPCPYNGEPRFAPSAGCLVLEGNSVLVVENFEGRISPPGGASRDSESAQCTAYRETWEETGLRLQPREHLATFDTGFHVYRCERNTGSGEIDPPPRLEVRRAFYLPLDSFDEWEWRFPGQDELLSDLAAQLRERNH
jgi:8-oxo-dGTP pyrophosphatase MutT (NUDIX family)